MATPQPAILNRSMGEHQWYVHLSRTDGADLKVIKSVIQKLRKDCADKKINLVLGFGPTLLKDLTKDVPSDFQPFELIKSTDGSGREAKATQEELLFWMNSPHKDQIWKIQWDARQALKGHMNVARETMTFIYGNSLDMTGFIDGTGNPDPADRDREVAIVPDGQPGAGGSFILAQRWIHDLEGWNKQSIPEQEGVFGRTKADSTRLAVQPAHSHLAHVELRQGATGDATKPKRDEITRRSTPYAFHDGTVGLYFMAFCKTQAPLRERLRAMYGADGQVRDKLTDYSNPASGSFYFAPSTETLNAALA
ncbi:MAG: Dyp-type peroxidase [Deltaproteobacteria bacterium]|nr:Dyp-type peroxidase [Deltaproteobacteria bacterium]